jgi:hypothetical protein
VVSYWAGPAILWSTCYAIRKQSQAEQAVDSTHQALLASMQPQALGSRRYIYDMDWIPCHFSSLRTRMEMVLQMLVLSTFNHLTWLAAWKFYCNMLHSFWDNGATPSPCRSSTEHRKPEATWGGKKKPHSIPTIYPKCQWSNLLANDKTGQLQHAVTTQKLASRLKPTKNRQLPTKKMGVYKIPYSSDKVYIGQMVLR